MSNIKSDILILYSNPSDTPRIRLDKEYRVIDKIIERFDIDPRRITRLHATSVNDFVAELQKGDFEIIQFSGHGSGQGIYLESYQIKERE